MILLVSSGFSAQLFAEGLEAEVYLSFRLQTQILSVDQATVGESDTQIGVEDAYSRVGGQLNFETPGLNLSAQLELSVNSPKLRLQDPTFFDHSPVRIAKFSASSDKWGTLWLGKGWLPYYNNIAAPVDYFSSRYSGYATYAYFREYALSYTTPDLSGLVASLTKIKRTANGASGSHLTLSYTIDGLVIAGGIEKMDGHNADTSGLSLSYAKGAWLSAIKLEKNAVSGEIANAYLQYGKNKLTYKGMLAVGKQYSGRTAQLGLDYQFNPALKLFVEYYKEENNYAVLLKGANYANQYLGAGGFGTEQNGRVWLLGLRYDLSRAF